MSQHGERTDWIPRLEIILAEGRAEFERFDRFAHFEASLGNSIEGLLEEFETIRAANIAQVARVMAKHFGRDAGPWAAYLPVLHDRN